jgi:alkylation response protein AidB-like acyl-CoA dehydrogenase
MDFTPSPRTSQIARTLRDFVEREVIPLEPLFLRTGATWASLQPQLTALRAKAKETGLFSPHMPKDVGGGGLDLLELARAGEELGRSPLGHYAFNCQAPDSGNMEVLHLHGTDEQKARWLVPLVRGDIRSCFSMTEPELPGSNPTWLATTARREGDTFIIDGHKWFTSSADGAAFAIVMAVTDPGAQRHMQASQIIVPCDTPGFRFIRNVPVMGHAGDGWASHAEIRYENCRVPAANLLGQQGLGFAIAQERLGPGRIHHCMRWIGICERSFELMCRYAAKREVAPGKPLGTRQIVQEWIADSRAEINAARLMVLHAAFRMQTEGAYEARDEISIIKFFVANVLQRVVDRAVQTHGALGVTDDTPLAYFYRGERAARIYDGADEVHKSSVARRILKRYGLEVKG